MSSTREYHLPIHQHGQEGTDCGCDVAGCCLECPLLTCKYEGVRTRTKSRSKGRDQMICSLLQQGLSSVEVAHRLSISTRSVYRIGAKYHLVGAVIS